MTNDLLSFDELKAYYGEPFDVTDNITITQPTIRDIMEFGEQEYFDTIFSITRTPTSMMSELDDMGIDYSKISDFYLFIMLTRKVGIASTSLFLPAVDLSAMNVFQKKESEELILIDVERDISIDELVYTRMMNYLRKTYGIKAQRRKPANKATRLAMISDDRETKALARKKDNGYHSILTPMIISLTCTEEFKYRDDEVLDLTYYQLCLKYNQIQKKKNALALLHGYYSGAFDTDKFKKDSLIWTYEPPK